MSESQTNQASNPIRYLDEALALYEHYAKPLEATHSREYVAVSPSGKTLLGSDLLTVSKQATMNFGPGNVVFKIGEIAVGKWL